MQIKLLSLTIHLLIFGRALTDYYDYDANEVDNFFNSAKIMCGMSVRVESNENEVKLISDDITWGAGSHQQVVTLKKGNTLTNSLWVIKEANQATPCDLSTPIKCGDVIRLEHTNMGVNLHQQPGYRSLLQSGSQVTGFGYQGNGNKNDNWQIVCHSQSGNLTGSTLFRLKNQQTGNFLNNSMKVFNQRNCPRCTIHGDFQVSGTKSQPPSTLWRIRSGFYIDTEY